MKKKILLTGASGHHGKFVREILLQKGFEVYAPTRQKGLAEDGIHWIKGNILDDAFIDRVMAEIKPEYLIHLAWDRTGVYEKHAPLQYAFLSSGIRLAQAFAENGGKRALYAGSFAEYAASDRPLKETDALDLTRTHYAFCKHHLHGIVERYSVQAVFLLVMLEYF